MLSHFDVLTSSGAESSPAIVRKIGPDRMVKFWCIVQVAEAAELKAMSLSQVQPRSDEAHLCFKL